MGEQLEWRKSSVSRQDGACLEVAKTRDGRAVRDSKDPDGPVLTFTQAEWIAFIAGAKAGEFD